ncbi:MAG: DnaJ domain-containing protein [Pseudomonadota bacterium]
MTKATIDRAKALETLGLSEGASANDIRGAWRALAFSLHPDRNDGDGDALAEVNAAYEFLRNENPATARPRPAPTQRPAGYQRRPAVVTRIVDLSDDEATACHGSLKDEPAHPEREVVAQHVPATIRRKGRKLSYIVRTALEVGSNRVALPAGELEGNRKVTPKVVTFSSAHRGPGRIVVPDQMREAMFPGAKSVSIHFEGVEAPDVAAE